ncbi:toxin-antitoxin system YwqK family antitoxin [Belliella kenyensis]|uniref:Toxin-antitoxin system YwqK family antitoxin n=1 Tax=Belliella kenyensis TaxID=1472724 RepID=A0ABV8EQS1_9BACT|nr:hypothetical protein [Belliella kenyensis]MCH7403561.1 hypothetical protein [Belliella kenyensis]MDN3604916.1 hypothetical protein [Belliella kenyensis]
MKHLNYYFLTIWLTFIGCQEKSERIESSFLQIEINEEGLLEKIGKTVDGVKEGEWRIFIHGKLYSIQNYKNGLLHGKETNFEPSGKKLEEGQWELGLRVGIWYFYDDGILVSVTEYENDSGKIIYHNPKFKYTDEIPPPPN